MANKILLIEDEQRLRRILQLVLLDAGYEVRTADNGRQGIDTWQQWMPDLVLTDLKMEPVDGLEVLRFRNRHGLAAPLVVLTAFGTVETAVQAIKEGAFDYLSKPVDNSMLLAVVERALASRSDIPANDADSAMIGTSEGMRKVRRQVAQFAVSDSAVLITGESGTGKELVARAIHAASAKSSGPFIKVNCAAIPAELMESELFGHKRGAFTGANEDFKGAFARADGGILFLDEIGDLPLALQAKLLNAVEEKKITPLGHEQPLGIDVKILSATNQDLEQMIATGAFRRDLYYRLNTVHIAIPPLRERETDIDQLTDCFLARYSKASGKNIPRISPDARQCLRNWPWPGNVRELSNVLERAVLTCGSGPITVDHFPSAMGTKTPPPEDAGTDSMDLNAREKQLIIAALEECAWNQTHASKKLGITRNTLRYRMKKFRIERS
jgi:DNA-binding NtrC family response regulator